MYSLKTLLKLDFPYKQIFDTSTVDTLVLKMKKINILVFSSLS